jgi:proteic killer suppression protein
VTVTKSGALLLNLIVNTLWLKSFYDTGSEAGIQLHHASKLKRQLIRLNVAKDASYMNMPGWDLHRLTKDLIDHYSVSVNGNWRLTFKFECENAVIVDYQDYH